jgi:hypothetical protein
MDEQSYYYDYDAVEQAKMARDIIKEVINQHGKILKQKHYYKYLEIFYDLLSKDLPEGENYDE